MILDSIKLPIKFIFFSLLILSTFSCGKEGQDPVFNNYSLVGVWMSRTGNPIFNIDNIKNEGKDEKYYEYQEGGQRLFRRTYQGITTTYQITYIDQTYLNVTARNNQGSYEMVRLK